MFGIVMIIVLIVCAIAKTVETEKREISIIENAKKSGRATYVDGRGAHRRTSDDRQFVVKFLDNGHVCWVDPNTKEILRDLTAEKEAKEMEKYDEEKQWAIEHGYRFFPYKSYNQYNQDIQIVPYEDITTGKRYVPYLGFLVNVETMKCEMRIGHNRAWYNKNHTEEYWEKERESINRIIQAQRSKVDGRIHLRTDDWLLKGEDMRYDYE